MVDLNRTIFENAEDHILICAHRGSSGANIPCNTLASFKAALMQDADMIELDVSKSKDGKYYVFHPGMERPHLHYKKLIKTISSKKVEELRFVNQDDCRTFLGVNTLEEVLNFLKGKCYINVDKFWTDVKGITEVIRKCGVENQVIVKTSVEDKYLDDVLKYASDLMFMPVIRKEDNITDKLVSRGINCIGAEVLFEKEDEPVASEEYIKSMHEKGRLLFANAIVYNSKDVIAAGRSDDNSIIISPDYGWGWLKNRGFDIIQTDWCGLVKDYFGIE